MKDLLQSLLKLSEGETKETGKGRVHKGSYGTSYEAGDEGVKKQETTRGRGRPKKDADETGEVKSYDTRTLGNVFGGGKKPAKEVGKVSAKHSIKEGETTEKKGGRVHKGSYGTSYEAGDEGVKKAETQRGRGRPKKGSDETGEVKSYDSSALNNVFGGKKPKKEVGKVSAKHSLKEYMESVEDTKNAEAIMEGMFGGVDHASVASNLSKLARVIKSVQTPEQFAVAQKYARRMRSAIHQHQHDKMGFGAGMKANIGVYHDVNADLKAKAQELGIPFTELEETGGDQVEIKPASATNTQVIQQGNKTLGTVNNPQLANQIKQSIGKGEMTLSGDDEQMMESKDQGKPGKNFAKIAKSAGKEYGSKAAGERVAGAVKAKLAKQGKLEEAKPDFLDVDKDGDKKESFKKAVKDKKKVAEGRDHEASEYLDEKVAKILAREKPGMDTVKSNDDFYAAIYNELIACGLTPKAARYKVSHDEDFISDVASAYDHYQTNPALDEGSIEDFAMRGIGPTNDFSTQGSGPGKSMAVPRGTPTTANRPVPNPTPFGTDPIAATTDRAINFISGLRKPSNPFSESNTMKDMQVESWSKQLDNLLSEGITVSSSQGQQGQPDSVSVTANDADAQALLAVLRQAGIGGFGGGEEQPQADAYGVISQGEEEPEGHGTEPELSPEVVGDGDDMLSLLKKMSGIGSAPTQGGEEGQDYEDEEGEEVGTLEPASDDEESDSQLAGDEDSDEEGEDEGSEEEEVTDEGNAFGQEVRQKKSDNIPDSEQRIKTGGQNLPVKEGEHECNECGMMESECECDHEQDQVNEYANDAGGDAMADAQLAQLKALLSVGNDLHKMKTTQAMGNPVRVTESKEMINQWKKLSGI